MVDASREPNAESGSIYQPSADCGSLLIVNFRSAYNHLAFAVISPLDLFDRYSSEVRANDSSCLKTETLRMSDAVFGRPLPPPWSLPPLPTTLPFLIQRLPLLRAQLRRRHSSTAANTPAPADELPLRWLLHMRLLLPALPLPLLLPLLLPQPPLMLLPST